MYTERVSDVLCNGRNPFRKVPLERGIPRQPSISDPAPSRSSQTNSILSSSSEHVDRTHSATEDTVDSNIQEAAQAFLEAMGTAHPLTAVVAPNPENPVAALLLHYLALIKADKVVDEGFCHWCYDNAEDDAVRFKTHRDHLSQHLLSCDVKHHPYHFRCPMCGTFVPVPE
ncbi:hypothetical protein K474DRAFT_658835 [Panus rudis PR-1116 ss-1]|nr:hypothetical protein K474DRAFT_658835 [Panus rudis PR-1116 ss-1]